MPEPRDLTEPDRLAGGTSAIDAALPVARRLHLVGLAAVHVRPVLGGEATAVERDAVVVLAVQREHRRGGLLWALRIAVGPRLRLLVRRAAGVRRDRAEEPAALASDHVGEEPSARISGGEEARAIDRVALRELVDERLRELHVAVLERALEIPREADAVGIGEERVRARGVLERVALVKARSISAVAVEDEHERELLRGVEAGGLDDEVLARSAADVERVHRRMGRARACHGADRGVGGQDRALAFEGVRDHRLPLATTRAGRQRASSAPGRPARVDPPRR